jgi:hypothetical protein
MDLTCRKDRGHAHLMFCNRFNFKRANCSIVVHGDCKTILSAHLNVPLPVA